MDFGYYQGVSDFKRRDIHEGVAMLILKYFFGRNDPLNNFAKNTVWFKHALSLIELTPK
jgi:hypothetical protein